MRYRASFSAVTPSPDCRVVDAKSRRASARAWFTDRRWCVLAVLGLASALQGEELLKEVVSREYTVNVGGVSVPDIKEVVSREFSFIIGDEPTPLYKDIVSREVSFVVATNAVPAAIATITAQSSPTGETVTLDWGTYGELTERDIKHYDVYRSSQPITTVTGLTPVATVAAGTFTYTFTGLPAFQDQYFAVVPVDALNGFNATVTYASSHVLGAEVISREYTLNVGGLSVPEVTEVVSRELSFVVGTNAAPAAIASLRLTLSPDGRTAVLDWGTYGELAERDVRNYDIYVQNAPFSIITGLTRYATVPAGTQTATLENLPTGGDLYFAVVPVDVLGNATPAVGYAVGSVLFPEVISREYTIDVGGISTPDVKDIASREFSFLVPSAEVPDPVTGLGSSFAATTSIGAYRAVDLEWPGYNEPLQRDVIRFRIYVAPAYFESVAAMTPFAYVPAGTLRHTLTGLDARGIYFFAVVAEDALGQFNPVVRAVSAQATPAGVGEVRDLAVESASTTLAYSWNAPENVNAFLIGYRVYFGGSATPVLLGSAVTTYTATGLQPARGYSFRIATVDIFGNESPGTSVLAATFVPHPTPVAATPFDRTVVLDWPATAAPELVKHYAVYVGNAPIASITGLAPVQLIATGTTATVSNLTNNQTYHFAVATVNVNGAAIPAITSVAATPAPDTIGPKALAFAPASPVSGSLASIDVTFSEALDAATVSTADATLTGPFGPVPLQSVALASPTVLRATFSAQTLSGTYTLKVGPQIADLAGNLMDQDADSVKGEPADDVFTAAIVLNGVNAPDLVVEAVSVAGTGVPGTTATVAWTVRNVGNGPATGPWTDQVALSFDGTTANVRNVGTLAFTGTLAAGATATRTLVITVPVDGPAGNVRAVVKTDSAAQIAEVDESNNAGLSTVVLTVPTQLALALSKAQIAETDGPNAATGTVTRNGDPAAALTVTLASNDSASASVPASVTIPAGQTSATFPIAAIADALVEPTKTVQFTASASGFASASASLSVTDVPPLGGDLSLSAASATVLEGDSFTLTITRSGSTAAALTVSLGSSNTAWLTLPVSATFAAGASTASVTVSAPQNSVVELDRAVTLTASATGYGAGTQVFTVVDDDTPVLSLTLTDIVISEAAGATATSGTVTRDTAASAALAVTLTSSNTAAVSIPATVTIPAGQRSVSFAVAALNNALVDGDRTVTIGAKVVIGATTVAQASPIQLTVLDDDGPRLALDIPVDLVGEGLSPAVIATVSRPEVAPTSLTVTLSSSLPVAATAPVTVVIPAGQNSVSFPITTPASPTADGTRLVTFRATAIGFAPSEDGFWVTDEAKSDLAVAALSAPSATITGTTIPIGATILNQGLVAAGARVTNRVYLSSDNVIGDDILIGTFTSDLALAAGATVAVQASIPFPDLTGEKWIYLQTDALNALPEIREDNNFSVLQPITLSAAYRATVTAAANGSPKTIWHGERLRLNGQALDAQNRPVPNVTVVLHSTAGQIRRTLLAQTDSAGTFVADWSPALYELGEVGFSAAHPSEAAPAVQDRVTVLGLSLPSSSVAVYPQEAQPLAVSIVATNPSNLALTGLTLGVTNVATGVNVALASPASFTVPAGATLTLQAQLTVSATAARDGSFTLEIGGPGGHLRQSVVVTYGVSIPRPQLRVAPQPLNAAALRGGQTTVDFDVFNDGTVASGPVQVLLPQITWLSALATNLPSISPGGSARVSLLLTPDADVPLESRQGTIVVQSAGQTVPVGFDFVVVSDLTTNLRIEVVDEFTARTPGAPKVAGAHITIRRALDQQLVADYTTDAAGVFETDQLVEGYYTLKVEGANRRTFTQTLSLRAGNNAITAVLLHQLVRFTWTVEPIQFEEHVRVTVESVFETNVPAPVLSIDPPVFDLKTLRVVGDAMTINVTVANKGFIEAESANLEVASNAYYTVQPLFTDLGRLPARSSVVIPVRITLIALPEVAGAAAAPVAASAEKRAANLPARAAAGTDPCAGLDFQANGYYWCFGLQQTGVSAGFVNYVRGVFCGGASIIGPGGGGKADSPSNSGGGRSGFKQMCGCPNDNDCDGTPNDRDKTPNGGPNPPGGCPDDFDCDGDPDETDPDDDNDGEYDDTDPDDRTPFDEGDASKNSDTAGDPISLISGNEGRTLVELDLWSPVGLLPLKWVRYGNTMSGKATHFPFGNGHNWSHGYQWELLVKGDLVEVLDPSGGVVGFARSGTDWNRRSPATDFKLTESGGFKLQAADGTRYQFAPSGRSYRGATVYRLDFITDAKGLRTQLSYNNDGVLDRVTDAAGNFLKINWRRQMFTATEWEPVAFGVSRPANSEWADWGVGAGQPYRYYRYWMPDTTLRFSAVSSITALGSLGTPSVTGDAISGGSPVNVGFAVDGTVVGRQAGYEGKSFTIAFSSAATLQGFSTRSSRSSGTNDADVGRLARGYLEAIASVAPTDNWLIDSVETSDGRYVHYSYQLEDDASLPLLRWAKLKGADYGDTHSAIYTYTQLVPGRRPLVRQFDDPRYDYPYSRTRNIYDTRSLGTDPSRYGIVKRQETASGRVLSERYVNKAASRYELRSANGQIEGVVVKPFSDNSPPGDNSARRYSTTGDRLIVTEGAGGAKSVRVVGDSPTAPIGSGRSQKRYDSLGRDVITTRADDGKGFVIRTTDPLGRVTEYDRTTFGNVARQTLPDNTVYAWSRNALDQPVALTITGPGISARTLTWTRDADNRVRRVDYPDGSYETFDYNSFGQVTRQRNQDGGVETFTYDGLGQRLTATNAEGETTTFGYNIPNGSTDFSAHLVDSVTDPKGRTTQFFYNRRGQIIRILYADGTDILRRYDRDGNLERERDELHRWTEHAYDDFGRRISTTNALTQTVRFVYDPAAWQDKPLEVRYPGGRVVRNDYDTEWRLTASTDGYGSSAAATTTFQYDKANNLVKVIDPLGRESTFTYDSRNRRETATDPLGRRTKFAYDAASNLLSVTRPDDSVAATHTYDEMDRRTRTVDARGAVTRFAYGRLAAGDGGSQLVSLTDARSNVYSWRYDREGRVERATYPDGSMERWTYDPAGLPATFTNRRGDVATHTYDLRNRQTRLDWSDPGTPDVVRTYDAAGRLATLDNGVSRLTYAYDAAGRMTAETQRPAALARDFTLTYAYDSAGLLSSLRYPGGRKLDYSYTARHELRTIDEGAATLARYTYDNAGQRERGQWGNGTRTDYDYDAAGRLTRLDHRVPTHSFARYAYTYDALDRRTVQDVRWAEGQTLKEWIDRWHYDETDQLVRAELGRENKEQRWAYDLLGNRQRQVDGAEITDYTANALNQYSALAAPGGPTTPEYDANGNLTKLAIASGGWIYRYDAQNRLTEAQNVPGTRRVVIAYDGANRVVSRRLQNRVSVVAPWADAETRYLVHNGWNEVEERDSAGTLVSSTVSGEALDELITRTSSTGTAYFHADPLGSVVAQSSSAPAGVLRYAYEPYGSTVRYGSGFQQPQAPPRTFENGFTGREALGEFGLSDYRRRAYSPVLGRFAQADPIGFSAGDASLYRYVVNAPSLYGDPTGEVAPALLILGGIAADYVIDSVFDFVGSQVDKPTRQGINQIRDGWDIASAARNPIKAIKKVNDVRKNILRHGDDLKNPSFSADDLSKAAGAADRGGLSAAGRQLDKHGGRSGSAFPKATGNVSAKNTAAQNVVDDILTTPGATTQTRHHARFGEVIEVRAPDGRGVRYDSNGKLIGLLEPGL